MEPRRKRIKNDRIVTPFKTIIIQEPIRARMAGKTEGAAKRRLEPPLIVQIDVDNGDPHLAGQERIFELQKIASTTLCQVRLISDQSEIDRSYAEYLLIGKYKGDIFQILTGGRVQTPELIDFKDYADNQPIIHQQRLLFVFPDLSVKTHGYFRLFISVINMERQVESNY